MSVSIESILRELVPAERALPQAYSHCIYLYTNGALSEEVAARYETLRQEVQDAERRIYDRIVSVLGPLGLDDRIEAPRPYPEIPPLSEMPDYLPGGHTQNPAVSTAGLGAIQVVWGVIVAAALVYMVLIGALAFVAWKALQVGQDIVDRVYSVRENTRRYKIQVDALQERFQACLARTGDVGGCAERFRTPAPTYELPPPRQQDPMVIFGAIAGVGVAGTLAYMGWRLSRNWGRRPKRISRRRGRPRRLSSLELERSLTE